ncbi:MAG: hypothetical protein A3F13_00455 [Gammaproteobacteria bacterium RIFCSPHIGHO2_12_FULL_40_19]|nr:MAG: hypothetical protein A3F13_00455 [Gammaproteobacteria bacterium RIFCSPHIGHO2_12_FULL_40_19]
MRATPRFFTKPAADKTICKIGFTAKQRFPYLRIEDTVYHLEGWDKKNKTATICCAGDDLQKVLKHLEKHPCFEAISYEIKVAQTLYGWQKENYDAQNPLTGKRRF